MKRFFALASYIDPKFFKLPTPSSRLARVLDLFEMEQLASQRLPKFVFDYIAGSAYREESAIENRRALAQRTLTPRSLRAVSNTTTAQTLFGYQYDLPVGIAPTGLTSLTHSEGELAGVRAAETVNIPFVLSTMSTFSIEDVAEEAPRANKWFQLYLRKNRQESLALIDRAKLSGYSTLVLTVDTAVPGNRLRDTRNGLSIPPKVSLRNLAAVAKRPAWFVNLLRSDPPTMANFTNLGGSLSDIVSEMFDPNQNWDDFDLVREHWNGNLVVKGVLHPDDAGDFVSRGADGIWVSNHGGRQLDRAVSPINIVAPIREAIGPNVPLLFDSGIMSGADVIAAIAEGADFAFMGRAYLYGLASGGEKGVEKAFGILKEELQNTLQLLGVSSVGELSHDHIIRNACNPSMRQSIKL